MLSRMRIRGFRACRLPLLLAAVFVAAQSELRAGDANASVLPSVSLDARYSGVTPINASKPARGDDEGPAGEARKVRRAKAKPDKPAPADATKAPAGDASALARPLKPGAKPPTSKFPTTLDDAKADAAAAAKPPPAWTEAEIQEAKARCSAILKRISAVAISQPQLREGACGAAAPIQLISIGRDPEVAISPPALMTCDLAEALDAWLKTDVQPLARKHLGAEVIRIESMSSYSCRAAYGRVGAKLSEHGLANALDIRGFVTSQAKTAYVLENWGTPQREISARIAAAKAAADKARAPIAAEAAAATAGPAGSLARGAIIDGVPKKPGGDVGETLAERAPSLSVAEPSRLGAAKPAKASSLVAKAASVKITIGVPALIETPDAKGAFLRQVHAAACRIFGTTLGPEANAAHRNHFHIDMAKRKSATTKICD